MLEIRKLLHSELKQIHDEVYFMKASNKAKYPLIVYSFEIYPQNNEDNLELVTLQIDGWDNIDDTTRLETMMENVRRNLMNKQFINDKQFLKFYKPTRLSVEDDDSNINRRTYTFNGRLYERN